MTKHSGKKAVKWGREGSKSKEELVDVIYGWPLRHIETWVWLGKSFTINTEQELRNDIRSKKKSSFGVIQ